MIMTQKRKLVLATLAKQGAPVEIKKLAKILAKKMNEATIYRALWCFLSEKLVAKVDWGKDKAYYEVISKDNHHHHLLCNNCGVSEDILSCDIINPNLILKNSKKFSQVTSHSLEYFGLCKKCGA